MRWMRRVGYQGDEMDEESGWESRIKAMRWMRRVGYQGDEMDEESRVSRR